MPDKWAAYAAKPEEDKWAQYAASMETSVQDVPGAVPGMAEPNATKPAAPNLKYIDSPKELITGAGEGIKGMFTHPEAMVQPFLDTLPSYGNVNGVLLPIPNTEGLKHGMEMVQTAKERPYHTAGTIAGPALLTAGIAKGAGSILPEVGSAIRTAAIGDTDAAALRALRVPAGSPKSLSTLRAVGGARPFLKGATSLEDVQSRIPAAKNEVWGPYQETVDAISGKKVNGPNGPTTVGELEAERQQLSALNRAIKKQNPEAIQLAQQKGMTAAQLLDQEKAVQGALDPHLEEAGIKPQTIRQTFGKIAQVGERVSGKSTLAEKPQPYGLGRIANLSLEHPLAAPKEILGGLRDIAAGRPWFQGSPTDVSIREAFRTAGKKPDFGAYKPGLPPLQLPASTIGNAPYGEEPFKGGIPSRPVRTGYAPAYPQLTAEAGPSRGIRDITPNTPPKPTFSGAISVLRGGISPAEPELLRPNYPVPQGRIISPAGDVRTAPRALLLEKTFPDNMAPQDTTAPLFPAGSAFRGVQDTPYYPAASAFRAKAPASKFNFDQYLDALSKAMKKKE